MKKALIALTATLISVEFLAVTQIPVYAQSRIEVAQTTQQPLPAATTDTKKPIAPMAFGLPDGTVVKLKFKQTISSKTAQTNDAVEFEVSEDIKIGNTVVIAKGATARGIVTEAKKSGMLGRKGKLNILVKDVDLVSGERITLRADQKAGGGNSAGIIAAAVLLSPFVLFAKGKNITYEAGTEVTSYVEGNFELQPSKFSVKK